VRQRTKPRRDHRHGPRVDPSTSPPEARRGSDGGRIWIYGAHAVAAALANAERKIFRLLATDDAFENLSADPSVPRSAVTRAQRVSRREIDAILGKGLTHQGLALHTEPLHRRLEDVIEIASARESAAIVILDQITDPHNAGAIVRSAAALGAAAVIAPNRNAPGEGGVLHKAASGAMERIAFVQVVNVARAIDLLKTSGFWVVGLAGDADRSLSSIDLKGRVAFVLGAEDEGLRRLVRESCDLVARLPIEAGVESLNVSNAAAIALYERARQTGSA
jgi:23S rRNA (guanosine2251-2'-O)-methyltransferase